MSRQRRSPRRSRSRDRDSLVRRPGIWLATLSTVVGIATGMFTLQDQVFPRESGTAVAVSDDAYQGTVGEICDEVNRADRKRVQELPKVKRRLLAAPTATPQRDALLDAARHELARGGHALSRFVALEPPNHLADVHRATEHAWTRNLDRVREYAARLDAADDWAAVNAALGWLGNKRAALGRDGVRINAGLQRVGGRACRIAPPRLNRSFGLPKPASERAQRHRGHDAGEADDRGASPAGGNGSGTGGTTPPQQEPGTGSAPPPPPPPPPPSGGGPSATTPSGGGPSATTPSGSGPSATTPGTSDPGAGGGGEDG